MQGDYFCTIWGDTREERTGIRTEHVNKHTGMLEDGGGGCCSAILVGDRHILTAGHCVHSGKNGDWYGGYKFYARSTSSGFTGTNGWNTDLESSNAFGWDYVWTFRGWTRKSKRDWDFAVIRLSSSPGLGKVTIGHDSGIKKKRNFYHRGYPCDKEDGSMWRATYELKDPKKYRLRFKKYFDVTNGNSGGPTYAYKSGKKTLYGIHTATATKDYLLWVDIFRDTTRIDKYKYDKICQWTGRDCN